MATHQRQRDQATGIIRAVNMLANAHAPENHACFGIRKRASHIAQHLGLNTAKVRHAFRWEALEVLFHRVPVFSERLNILFVVEFFFNDHMHDRVEHRHIRTGAEL